MKISINLLGQVIVDVTMGSLILVATFKGGMAVAGNPDYHEERPGAVYTTPETHAVSGMTSSVGFPVFGYPGRS